MFCYCGIGAITIDSYTQIFFAKILGTCKYNVTVMPRITGECGSIVEAVCSLAFNMLVILVILVTS
jgi:hypothetical protein